MNTETLFSITERALMVPLIIYILMTLKISEILQISTIISSKTWIFLEIICLILLLIAFISVDPVIYTTALGLFVIISYHVNAGNMLIVILVGLSIIMLILDTIKTGWRNNQPRNLGVISFNSFSLIILMLVFSIFFIIIPFFNSGLASIIINLFSSIPSPKDPALIPLWAFLTDNIVGRAIIVIIALAVTYRIIQESGSIIAMYIMPSKNAVIDDAKEWLTKETWLEPALKYIGSFAESIIIAPFIYTIFMISLDVIFNPFNRILNPFVLSIVNFITALLIFFIVWYFISKLMSFEPIKPSLKSIIVTGIIVILILLVVFIKYSIIINPLNPTATPLDSYIVDTYISFYTTLFIIVQWILILMGVAP